MNTTEIKPVVEFDTMIDSLVKDELATTNEMAEVNKLTYLRDSEMGSVAFDGRPGRLALTKWSARQLCKLSGIPFGVWLKSSEKLAGDMLGEFLPLVKDPQRKLMVRTYGNKSVLRGLLPIDYPDIHNSDILKGVGDAAAASKNELVVVHANWLDETNTPLFRTRFVMKDLTFHVPEIKEDLYVGLDCLSSEVGGGPLSINILLYRPICTNGMIQVFDNRSYFHYNYDTKMSVQVGDVLNASLDRVNSDMALVHDAVTGAISKKITLAQAKTLLTDMSKENQLNKGVSLKAIGEMEKSGVDSMWDVANAVTSVARSYRDQLRLRYEVAGGALMGLRFKRKSKVEEDWVSNIPQYLLPASSGSQQVATP